MTGVTWSTMTGVTWSTMTGVTWSETVCGPCILQLYFDCTTPGNPQHMHARTQASTHARTHTHTVGPTGLCILWVACGSCSDDLVDLSGIDCVLIGSLTQHYYLVVLYQGIHLVYHKIRIPYCTIWESNCANSPLFQLNNVE